MNIRRNHTARTLGLALLLIAANTLAASQQTPPAGAAPVGSEINFLTQQAIARSLAARTPDEFGAAATAYAALLGAGVHNATIYFNYGTALLLAERRDDAQRALAQAERYAGANWDTERNLRLARTSPGDDAAGLPWYRVPLFWHFRLATPLRITLACGAFLAVWLFTTLRLLGSERVARWGFTIAVIAFILLGSSAGTSLYQDARARAAFMTAPQPDMGDTP